MVRSCYPPLNSEVGGHPFQVFAAVFANTHIHSCPPYVEAVSSIRNLTMCHPFVTRETLM